MTSKLENNRIVLDFSDDFSRHFIHPSLNNVTDIKVRYIIANYMLLPEILIIVGNQERFIENFINENT